MKIPVHRLVGILGTPATSGLTVERRDALPVPDALGRISQAAASTFTANFVVHQATRQQLERAGLDYAPNWKAFYSETELRTTAPNAAQGTGDVVLYQGERWELVDAGDYADLGGLHLALGRRQE